MDRGRPGLAGSGRPPRPRASLFPSLLRWLIFSVLHCTGKRSPPLPVLPEFSFIATLCVVFAFLLLPNSLLRRVLTPSPSPFPPPLTANRLLSSFFPPTLPFRRRALQRTLRIFSPLPEPALIIPRPDCAPRKTLSALTRALPETPDCRWAFLTFFYSIYSLSAPSAPFSAQFPAAARLYTLTFSASTDFHLPHHGGIRACPDFWHDF